MLPKLVGLIRFDTVVELSRGTGRNVKSGISMIMLIPLFDFNSDL